MKKRLVMRYVFIGLSVLLAVVIFLFSSQDRTQSGETSEGFAEFWRDVLSGMVPSSFLDWMAEYIRKGAHIFLYACLGLTVTLSCMTFDFGRMEWAYFALPVLLCFLYACTDEIHQIFVAGRSGKFADVLVDGIGFVLSALVCNLIRVLSHFLKKRKEQKEEKK